MEEISLIDIADDLLIVNKTTIEKLFQLDNAADCVALYMFYYKTAKWQKTNQPKANDEYVKDCLKWGKTRLTQTKHALLENGLIEIIQARKDGKISGWYVKVSYLVSQEKIKDIKIRTINEDSNKYSEQQVLECTSTEQNTNTLKVNNKYLKRKKENTLKEKEYIVENKEIFESANIIKKSMLMENVKCIIDYLNESINTKYRYDTKGTINLIKARFKEGYKLDNFYDVIDKKVQEWKGTDFEQYLRPSTLFGNKFENYLNQTYFKGTTKSSYSSKPTFDNTQGNVRVYHISDEEFNKLTHEEKLLEMEKFDAIANMTPLQKEFHNKYCLARDENGNLLKF